MPVLHERVWTRLPIEKAFDFIADFGNAGAWDPGTATSVRVDAGPLGVGSRFRLGVRMGRSVRPMEYRIVSYDRPRMVVLEGEGSGVSATDRITFEADADFTWIDYSADIRLRGLLRLASPIAGGQFARIASQARQGMQSTLDQLADRERAA